MCRTVHALLQTIICGIQMLVRVFMTVILMIENVIRMLLQTLYNFISFLLQMISLIPICVVFLLTARLKCFMCGGGGPCPVNRGGTCDCLMSLLAFVILFFIFRATGVLDKIFYSLGYAKAPPYVYKFMPTQGDITECSRNDTDTTLTPTMMMTMSMTDSTTETTTPDLRLDSTSTTNFMVGTMPSAMMPSGMMPSGMMTSGMMPSGMMTSTMMPSPMMPSAKPMVTPTVPTSTNLLRSAADVDPTATAIEISELTTMAGRALKPNTTIHRRWTTVFYYFV
ncbi:uncharacterized protein LOC128671036 [Plodia interpunctella]|uniref:uncharacterized protein LOC128671036 n=1 Tax=Plodia interpunctella TaxID=58824 RepID=UPI002368BC7F|nr:uncharacterized protein LOC128671036 [Plodia interpunctella]